MTNDQRSILQSGKMDSANSPSLRKSKTFSESATASLLAQSSLRVEPITKLREGICFTRECLLGALHSDMRSEREHVENTLVLSAASAGRVDYSPLSDVAVRHARRAEIVSGVTEGDLETIERIATAICEGRVGELKHLLYGIDCQRIDVLSEGLQLALRTESFWIGIANGWLHFMNKESGRSFLYCIGFCPEAT